MKRAGLRFAALGLALAALATGGTARVVGEVLAPDGQRGFGAQSDAGAILRIFRQPDARDEAFLAQLYGLEGEIRPLIALARERYRERRYFDLVRDARGGAAKLDDLEDLHAAFRAAEAKSVDALRAPEPAALAYARMYFDLRFRMRLKVLETFERENSEFQRGLAVLRAATDGYVVLTAEETRAIGGRVDLAASVLRAVRADLTLLRTPKDAETSDAEDERRARALHAVSNAARKDEQRASELARWLEDIARAKLQMESVLTTPRMLVLCDAPIRARQAAIAQARKFEERATLHFPDERGGKAATPEIERMPKGDRMRYVRYNAGEGSAIDPLNAELAWLSAKAADHFDGELLSRPWFDRYLALRGIRAHDWRTVRGRELTAKEREALDVVQRGSRGALR